jgi:hypothetical protein
VSLLGLKLPSNWNMTFQWFLQSGRAYTPTVNDLEVAKRYSANGPIDNIIDLRLTKYFGQGKWRTRFYLDVENMFNTRRVRRVDSETGKAPVAGVGSYEYEISDDASEDDISRAISATNARATNPNFWGPPRQITLGMGVEW